MTIIASLLLIAGMCHAQIAPPTQTTMNIPLPAISSTEPVEMNSHETLSMATGALSLNIPVVSLPQRGGGTLNIGFVYSNAAYKLQETDAKFVGPNDMPGVVESSVNIQMAQNISQPWESPIHPNLPTLTADLSYSGYDTWEYTLPPAVYYPNIPEYCMQNWTFTDWDGSTHTFPGTRDCSWAAYHSFAEQIPLSTKVSQSNDDSDYILDATNPNDIRVIRPDGTVYHFLGYSANYVTGLPESGGGMDWSYADLSRPYYYYAAPSTIVDRNGNTISITNTGTSYVITDTVGRKITIGFTVEGNTISYMAMNGSGSTSVSASAAPSGTTTSAPWPYQFSSNGPCQVDPVSNSDILTHQLPPATISYGGPGIQGGSSSYIPDYTVTLPNGSQYVLTFDVVGDLIKVQYPTGGYMRYDYAYGLPITSHDYGDVTCSIPSTQLLAKHECTLANGACTQAPTSTTPGSCTRAALGRRGHNLLQPLDGSNSKCLLGWHRRKRS